MCYYLGATFRMSALESNDSISLATASSIAMFFYYVTTSIDQQEQHKIPKYYKSKQKEKNYIYCGPKSLKVLA